MANEQMITIRGRLTGPPELRFTPSGAAVANFTIASNARVFDKQSQDWKDKDPIFWRCSAWRELAENVAETLDKGMAVIAFAELESRSFDTKEGEKRTVTEARIEAIGADLRWASAQVTRTQRSSQGGGFGNGTGGNSGGGDWGGSTQQSSAPANDPWGVPDDNSEPF